MDTMRYTQKKFLFTKTVFEFKDRVLDYTIEDERGMIGFSVFYEDIAHDTSVKTIVEKWPKHMAIVCLFEAGIAASFRSAHPPNFDIAALAPVFMCIGLIFLLLARFKVRFNATILKAPNGNLVILPDDQKSKIMTEIETRRKNEIRRKYAEVNPFAPQEQEIARLRRLMTSGIISEMEYNAVVTQLSQTGIARKDGF